MSEQWTPADPQGGGQPPRHEPSQQSTPPSPPTQQPQQPWQHAGQGIPPGAQPPRPTGYGAPPGGYGQPLNQPPGAGGQAWGITSPPAITENEARGFFAALFDFSFATFVTPLIVKFLYVLITIGVAMGYLYVVVAFNASAGFGFIMLLIIGPIVSIVILAFYRVTLELYISVVRMSEDIHQMQRTGRAL